MKKILYVWIALAIILVGGLTFIGVKVKSQNAPYTEIEKELVFADTLFVNKDYTLMWLKNTSGSIKTYELNEVIELDEKDRKIADLEAKLDKLVKEKENEQYVNEDANGTTSSKKSTNGKSNKSSNE